MEAKTHWEEVYEKSVSTEVSWFQKHPELSLRFVERTGVGKSGHIIDVGGGSSSLVDELLNRDYQNITVLDLSGVALSVARARLGSRADAVTWLEADITRVELPREFYDVWHDRAVFHFLRRAEDRQKYVDAVRSAVKPGGHVVVATFGVSGPSRCSGLEVVRYTPEGLHNAFGGSFEMVRSADEAHRTPSGKEQKFIYCYCRKG